MAKGITFFWKPGCTSCVKARELVERKVSEDQLTVRHLVKEPLSVDELRRLAPLVGGADNLVAPKKRAEAAGLAGDELLAWLAADGTHLRRPIVVAGKKVTVGYSKTIQAELEALLDGV